MHERGMRGMKEAPAVRQMWRRMRGRGSYGEGLGAVELCCARSVYYTHLTLPTT